MQVSAELHPYDAQMYACVWECIWAGLQYVVKSYIPTLAMKMKRLFIFTSDRLIFILPWSCCVHLCKKREQQCVCLCAQNAEMMCVTCSLPYQLSSAAQPSSCSLRGHWPRPHTRMLPLQHTWHAHTYLTDPLHSLQEWGGKIFPFVPVCVSVCVYFVETGKMFCVLHWLKNFTSWWLLKSWLTLIIQ